MAPGLCPEPVLCDIGYQLPNPGCTLLEPVVKIDGKAQRIRIELRLHQKPGAWPCVIVPTTKKVELGVLDKGRYIVEVYLSAGKKQPARALHVFLLDGR